MELAARWAAKAYGGNTRVSTKKVPCTAAPAGAPWTSFVAAVDEVDVKRGEGILRIKGRARMCCEAYEGL